jgi:hypothetical protein
VYLRGGQIGAVIMWFIFCISEDNIVEILDISAQNNDGDLLWFCGRAGLNALDLAGFKNIISKNENLGALLIKLGFHRFEEHSTECRPIVCHPIGCHPIGCLYRLILTDEYFNAGCSGGNKK